jgi:hypothetical protein
MRNLEIVTEHLQGTCVTRSHQVHGLFRLTRSSSEKDTCRPGDAVAQALRAIGNQDQTRR